MTLQKVANTDILRIDGTQFTSVIGSFEEESFEDEKKDSDEQEKKIENEDDELENEDDELESKKRNKIIVWKLFF